MQRPRQRPDMIHIEIDHAKPYGFEKGIKKFFKLVEKSGIVEECVKRKYYQKASDARRQFRKKK